MASSSVANPHNNSHRRIHPNASSASLARHAAKCRVCNHPSRVAIEFDFLNWRNPFDLAQSYGLLDISSIYRHAHATGLFGRRRLNIRFALERMVERVGEVPVTASAILRSVRAITRINDAGEWIDPPARVIISREDPPSLRNPRVTIPLAPTENPIRPLLPSSNPRSSKKFPPMKPRTPNNLPKSAGALPTNQPKPPLLPRISRSNYHRN